MLPRVHCCRCLTCLAASLASADPRQIFGFAAAAGFLPDELELKAKLLKSIEAVTMVTQPSELMELAIGPAITMLYSIGDNSQGAALAMNYTMGE